MSTPFEPVAGHAFMEMILAGPPEVVSTPQVTGDATVGQSLNCTMGVWVGMEVGSYEYHWQRDGAPIDHAPLVADYLLVDADVGALVNCVVIAQNALGLTAADPTNEVGPVGAAP